MSKNTDTQLPLDQLRQIRIEKLNKLREIGINPYPQPFINRTPISHALDSSLGVKLDIVGRVVAKRGHGKMAFLDVKDFSGKIQLVVRSDVVTESSEKLLSLLDVGDFIKATGETFTTQAGQYSILVSSLGILSKSIRPLPNKWEGMVGKEEKYRQRYADMITDEKTFNTLVSRSTIVQLFRQFFIVNGFYEVNTPTLQEMYGGASAKPFTTHHNALDSDFFLRISPELYLKRLIVGGFEKVFEFTINFRNEGIGRWHNPEFQNIEFYWAYSNYEEMMDFTEEMFKFVVKGLTGGLKIKYGDLEIDFSKPFPRVTFRDALIKYSKIDFEEFKTEESLRKELAEKKLLSGKDLKTVGYANLLDILYKRTTRPNLQGPMYITDYPAEMIALAKRKEDDNTKIATFQLLIDGEEFVKAYNEVNDPLEQKARWEETEKTHLEGQEEAERLDDDYVRALEYGMPPTAGWGLGLERTIALLTDNHSIKDVMYFPLLKPEVMGGKLGDLKNVSAEKNSSVLSDLNSTDFAKLPDENSKRFIAVLNKKAEMGKLLNALGHMTGGLTAGYELKEQGCYLEYKDKSNGSHPFISHFPFIVLKADNSNKIRKIREQAVQKKIPFTDFTSTMTIGTSQNQVEKTSETEELDLEYYGICLFGSTEELKELTGKLSLFN